VLQLRQYYSYLNQWFHLEAFRNITLLHFLLGTANNERGKELRHRTPHLCKWERGHTEFMKTANPLVTYHSETAGVTMNAFIMQQSSDLERTIRQQQQELHQLAQSLQSFSGICNGVGSSAASSNRDVGSLRAGSSHTTRMNSLTNRQPIPAHPNFVDDSLLLRNSHCCDSFQQTGCFSSSCITDIVDGFCPLNQALLQQDFSRSLRGESQTKLSGANQTVPAKKMRLSEPTHSSASLVDANPTLVEHSSQICTQLYYVGPSDQGQDFYGENDVLSGRGGGTNVHLGNRHFRAMINLHRSSYLKARKNDKPAISRAIVQAIRAKGGNFLKKCETTGLWFEVGDDVAREKTSQALRQRAPEMRKKLFKHMVYEDRVQQQYLQEQEVKSHLIAPLNRQQLRVDSLVSLTSTIRNSSSSNIQSANGAANNSFQQRERH
jgi:hypothetical protein